MTEGDFDILDAEDELSLLETLDHVLDRGLVIAGEVTISVADIDLIYVGLNLLLGSVESIDEVLGARSGRLEGAAPEPPSPSSGEARGGARGG